MSLVVRKKWRFEINDGVDFVGVDIDTCNGVIHVLLRVFFLYFT